MAENNKNNSGLAGVLKFLIIAGIVVTAIVTCPDEKAHKQAVKEAIRKVCVENGITIGGGVIGSIFTATVTSTNCIVFSLGKISFDGQTKIVSVGVFGKVFFIRNPSLS